MMARKAGLGRGLDALIPGLESESSELGSSFVSINKIKPNPMQPRFEIESKELQELADSIHEHGILQPLIVSQDLDSGSYILIAGERRLRAAQLAGLEMVPVIIRQVSDQERLELALIENVQREDLNPLETAEAYHQLVEQFQLKQEEIAIRVGKNRATVANTLRLLNLSELARKALAEGRISEGHARTILSLPTVQAQNAALQTMITHDLNVRQAEELCKKLSGEKVKLIVKPEKSPEIKELETRLRDQLGTKVTLQHSVHGGTLTIHYYSDEELDSIVEKILD
jgi:ParB family transcriptional regulator, chromosome partitioning protein